MFLHYLVLPALQVYGDGKPLVKFFQAGEDRGHPGGAEVVIVDVVQRVSVQLEAEHAVVGGVISTVRDAVPFHYRVHSWVTGGAAARRLGMEGRDSCRVHLLNLPSSYRRMNKQTNKQTCWNITNIGLFLNIRFHHSFTCTAYYVV